jgi:hypothetical protein
MALERQNLRDELVAMIAAGRELSPEHDRELADVYLDHVHRHYTPRQERPRWFEDPERLRTLLAAAVIALAALLFSFFVFAATRGGDRFDRGEFGPRSHFRDPNFSPAPPWFNPKPQQQFPQQLPNG